MRTVPPLARSRLPAEAWSRPRKTGKPKESVSAERPRGRGPARRRPGGLSCSCFRIEVGEDLLDQRRILDAGDDAQRPAAHRA